jgi:hypothetical protein
LAFPFPELLTTPKLRGGSAEYGYLYSGDRSKKNEITGKSNGTSATESNDKELRLRWLKTSSAAYTFSTTLACSVYSFTTATNRLIGSSGVRMTTCESEPMKRLGVQGCNAALAEGRKEAKGEMNL